MPNYKRMSKFHEKLSKVYRECYFLTIKNEKLAKENSSLSQKINELIEILTKKENELFKLQNNNSNVKLHDTQREEEDYERLREF
jgi:hypothetical protein